MASEGWQHAFAISFALTVAGAFAWMAGCSPAMFATSLVLVTLLVKDWQLSVLLQGVLQIQQDLVETTQGVRDELG